MADMETHVNSCDCYVDAARIETQVDFPRTCLDNCRMQFLNQTVSTVAGWTNETWPTGCEQLTSKEPSDDRARSFWSLYWCDTRFCGVAISQTGGLEQDPNVGLIINTCQNIGYHSVLDPGPPPLDFSCKTEPGEAKLCTIANGHHAPAETGSVAVAQASTTMISSAPAAFQATERTEQTMATQTEPRNTPTRATMTTTSSSSPSPAAPTTTATHLGSNSSESPNSAPNSTTSGSPLSSGAKIAIGVCSALALVFLIALALFCLYRRKRERTSLHRTLRTHLRLTQPVAPSSSPTPLISTTHSGASGHQQPPLTPPLRLRDRRFLPSILRPGNRSPSPPLTPLTPAYSPPAHHLHPGSNSGVFPASPICSPTTSKLVPRHERARVHAGSVSSTNTTTAPAMASAFLPGTATSRGSLSSYGGASASSVTGTGPSSLRNEISQTAGAVPQVYTMQAYTPLGTAGTGTAMATVTPPSSPTRPPRPHDAPLEIPDLVSPASPGPLGPPPNRALPPPPPPPPLPPALGSMTGGTASFTAVGGGRSLVPRGVQVVKEGEAEGDYDPRGSWGSWSGTASGVGGKGG
ncbi:hypothetical protein B0T16DRAFT_462764 [Cercophora newfieldiana]|uniref:Uncharacterized protein n=1 Tax=Cercophora newfieldiana TaxID=92897 RepID=A0AA39XSP0_9PEZI|nr:hypothetical protein B0T16DRAFT_462764 [Cercophora newfieldiana]